MIDNELLSADDGVSKLVDVDATDVAREYYRDYAKYVLEYRALPAVEDGLKPVQRRIIYIANQQPKKLMKTAKLSGLVMALHPHGSASISGAINEMAHPLNVFPLFTTKGNFGGVGFGASADRYTECYLSEAARLNFCQFVDYADYEVGEIGEMEPSSLPTLIPYSMFKGSEGIGIGLSTKVMPLNLIDLIDYYIDYIKHDGKSKKKVRPDVGYVLLETDDWWSQITEYKGRITTSSIVTQISNTTFLVEGLYGKSVDAVINKIDKYDKSFTDGKVGFRNASTTSEKYVFEIYDSSIIPEMLKENLEWATRGNTTFNRVLEEDGNAVYSSFDYTIKKSLECLNKAIDKKIKIELDKNRKQLKLYEVLKLCKEKGVFKKVTEMTSEELVDLILRTTGCPEEIAREVIKRPISYLTKSHTSEEDSLKSQISELENHDRKKYLISLYKELRKAVLPIFEEKKHTMSKGDLISSPCIKLDGDLAQVTDGDGMPFKSTVYFVSDAGYVYPRTISSLTKSEFIVETSHNDKIVGFVTDDSNYLSIYTRFNYRGWFGAVILDLSTITYDKKVINFREDEGEYISSLEGSSKLSKKYGSALKSKLSKSTYFKG